MSDNIHSFLNGKMDEAEAKLKDMVGDDSEPVRNYYDEAWQIALGKSKLLAQKEHIIALCNYIRGWWEEDGRNAMQS